MTQEWCVMTHECQLLSGEITHPSVMTQDWCVMTHECQFAPGENTRPSVMTQGWCVMTHDCIILDLAKSTTIVDCVY